MSYSTIEAAIETLVRAYSGGTVFTAALGNVDRGDYRTKDAAGTSVACTIVQVEPSDYAYTAPGGRGTHGARMARHVIGLDLYVKRGQALGGDGIAYAAILTLRDGLIAHMERYPLLNGTAGVKLARTISATRPIMLVNRNHVFSRITMEAIEQFALDWVETPG